MKKKIINHHISDTSEVSEQQYQQKLRVGQRILQTFLNSFNQCFYVPFYPYDYTVYPRTDSSVNQQEDNENKKCLEKQK